MHKTSSCMPEVWILKIMRNEHHSYKSHPRRFWHCRHRRRIQPSPPTLCTSTTKKKKEDREWFSNVDYSDVVCTADCCRHLYDSFVRWHRIWCWCGCDSWSLSLFFASNDITIAQHNMRNCYAFAFGSSLTPCTQTHIVSNIEISLLRSRTDTKKLWCFPWTQRLHRRALLAAQTNTFTYQQGDQFLFWSASLTGVCSSQARSAYEIARLTGWKQFMHSIHVWM